MSYLTCSVLWNKFEVMQGLTDAAGTPLRCLHTRSCMSSLLEPLPVGSLMYPLRKDNALQDVKRDFPYLE